MSEDLETGSLNREGTYTPISFEITNDEGYQYENKTQSHNLLSDDIEIVSFNRDGTYTPSSFEVTNRNDEGYQYENNTQSHRAASHQDTAEMNDEGIIHELGETNISNSCIIQDNNTDTQYELNNQETNLKECVSRKSEQHDRLNRDQINSNEQYEQPNNSQKTKPIKKNRKKETIDIEQQLTACKARVIVLEEQNREYENTISLLHRLQRTDEIVQKNDDIRQCSNNSILDLKTRMTFLEDSVTTRLNTLNQEVKHKLEIQELKFKHEMEINRLKIELTMMKNNCFRKREEIEMCSRSTQCEPGNRDLPEMRHPTYNPQQSRNYPGGAYTNNHLQNPYVYVVSTNTTESAPARNIQDGSSYVATAMNNNMQNMFKHGYAPSRPTHLTNPVLQVQQGQCNPSMYRYIQQSHVTPQQVYGVQFIHSREVPTSHINQNSQTRRANQATRTKSSNRYEDRKMKLRRNEGERKTAKPNLAKQINSTVAVSEPPETVNQSNQDNAREESHTNPTDNSNLQGNVDENKEYEHKFLGQERAATNTQSETKIVVGTLNIQNAKSNDLYLKQTLKRCDILCVQEHWLFSFEKDILMNISKNHEYRAKCVDEETETESIICGRGYGGVATFWRKSIDHAIKYYNDGNERINVITVNIKEQPLCIISVYMPSENSNRDEKYKDTMAQLEEIIDKFAVDHQIMICGDFNASVHQDNRSRDRCLKNFMESNQLLLTNGYHAPRYREVYKL